MAEGKSQIALSEPNQPSREGDLKEGESQIALPELNQPTSEPNQPTSEPNQPTQSQISQASYKMLCNSPVSLCQGVVLYPLTAAHYPVLGPPLLVIVIMTFLMVTSTVRLLPRLGREAGRPGAVLPCWTVSRSWESDTICW